MLRRLALLLVVSGCGGPSPKLSDLENEVFRPSCAYTTCHATAGASNGLDFEKPGLWMRLVDVKSTVGKKLVTPGDSNTSYLLDKLQPAPMTGVAMPPGAPLNDFDVERIRRWINAGAMND